MRGPISSIPLQFWQITTKLWRPIKPIKAGYSKKTAKEIGSENLTKPNISSYIEERMKELQ